MFRNTLTKVSASGKSLFSLQLSSYTYIDNSCDAKCDYTLTSSITSYFNMLFKLLNTFVYKVQTIYTSNKGILYMASYS